MLDSHIVTRSYYYLTYSVFPIFLIPQHYNKDLHFDLVSEAIFIIYASVKLVHITLQD